MLTDKDLLDAGIEVQEFDISNLRTGQFTFSVILHESYLDDLTEYLGNRYVLDIVTKLMLRQPDDMYEVKVIITDGLFKQKALSDVE